jgi:O-antigen ligase
MTFITGIVCLQIVLITIGPYRASQFFGAEQNIYGVATLFHAILNLVLLLIVTKKARDNVTVLKNPKLGHKKEIDFYLITALFVFLGYMSVSVLWSSFGGSVVNQYSYLIQIVICGVLFGKLSRRFVLQQFTGIYFFISCIVFVVLSTRKLGIAVFPGDQLNSLPDRFLIVGAGPNVWPRWLIYTLIFVTWGILFDVLKQKISSVLSLIIFPIIWILALSGSRAAYIAFSISLVFLLVVSVFRGVMIQRVINQYRFSMFISLLISIILEIHQNFPASRMVFFRLFQVSIVEKSASGRGAFVEASIAEIQDHYVIGGGEGSFTGRTGLDYPHNIFLDVLVTGGLVGLIFFSLVIFLSVKVFYDSRFSQISDFSLNVLIFTWCLSILVLQMFSGTFADARIAFMLLPLLSASTYKVYLGKSTNLV